MKSFEKDLLIRFLDEMNLVNISNLYRSLSNDAYSNEGDIYGRPVYREDSELVVVLDLIYNYVMKTYNIDINQYIAQDEYYE